MRLTSCPHALTGALALLVVFAVASGCGQPEPVEGPMELDRDEVAAVAEPIRAAAGDEGEGLAFTVREAGDDAGVGAPGSARPPVADAAPLPEEQASGIFERLPALPDRPSEQVPFRVPSESPPAPRTGETEQQPFPPPGEAGPAPRPGTEGGEAAGPLRVLRYAPEGAVPLAPHVSITFSQPMVAVSGLADLSRGSVPARIEPDVPGRWRWIGTRTLLFEPAGERLPMATSYRVTIPAGVQPVRGEPLAEATSFAFETPPPTLQQGWPRGRSQPLEPILVACFDQRVDAAAMLAAIEVQAGGETFSGDSLRLASPEEVAASEAVAGILERAGEGRAVAFKVGAPLPKAAEVRVVVRAGAPSAEGPRRTAREQAFTFHTYGPLTVTQWGAAWGRHLRPLAPFYVELSNPLAEDAFRKEWVTVEPEIAGLEVDVAHQRIQLQGLTKAETSYEVTIAGQVRDIYGQTLGMARTVVVAVDAAEPSLFAQGQSFTALDPYGPPAFRVYSTGYEELRLQVFRVEPADWAAFVSTDALPGRLVLRRTVDVADRNALTETAIDLAEAFGDGAHLVLHVEGSPAPSERWRQRALRTWIERSPFGVSVHADADEALIWVNDLRDGSPVAGAEVTLLPEGVSAVTGEDGTVEIALPEDGPASAYRVVVARKDGREAMLPGATHRWQSHTWGRRAVVDRAAWYVASDRGLYQPGEEVRFKGWVRRIGAGPGGDVGAASGIAQTVRWRLVGPRSNELAKGDVELSGLGGFDIAATIPEDANLGHAQLIVEASAAAEASGALRGLEHHHTIQIQEFRRPEFEVEASVADAGPHLVGQSVEVAVEARYYAGGALPNADVSWRVSSSAASFTPPGRGDFTFGRWVPWWSWRGGHGGEDDHTESLSGRTDASGRHAIRIAIEASDPPFARSLQANATVVDVNRQAWSAQQTLLVHPGSLYAGLRAERAFVHRGQPLVLEAIACGIDGALAAGARIDLVAVRLDWSRRDGRWQEDEVEVAREVLEASGEGPLAWSFTPEQGGTYKIRARVVDDRDRPSLTELTAWVAGGERPPATTLELEEVMLIPDRATYAAGDVAEILVQSPFANAEGLLVIGRDGRARSQRFRVEGTSATLRVPIEEGDTPNLHVLVDLVGAAARDGAADDAPKRPAFARGQLDLQVPPAARTLAVEANPREAELEPGAETVIELLVKDADGRAVEGAEALVVVVDEALLALSGYELPDPLGVFYPHRSPGVNATRLRGHVILADVSDLVAMHQGEAQKASLTANMALEESAAAMPPGAPAPRMARGFAAGSGAADGEAAAIQVREDLSALALFAPAVRTDADGRAAVPVKLPDSLTRYRIMAVAVAPGGKQYGQAESTLTARLPLMVRPALPRFLRYGDRFELAAVIQNQTDEPLETMVAVRATNLGLDDAETQPGAAGRLVTVPARDRVEVRLPARALSAGTARVQIVAVSGRFADAAVVEIPVWTPATAEAFATYGVIDGSDVAAYAIEAPQDVVPEHGGLEVTTASTRLQALTDAVIYLAQYPYGCVEQISSRVLSIVALKDVLAAFEATGLPPEDELIAAVERDVKKLSELQNHDGGFGFWRAGEESWPYVSVHAAHALARGRARDFDVDPDTLERAQAYLKTIRRRFPSHYPERARWTIEAYALYVRALLGDASAEQAKALLAEATLERLPLEACGFLVTVLGDGDERERVLRHLGNRVEETAAGAHFTTGYDDGAYLVLASDRRADAVILDALMAVQPGSDLIPKIVEGLLAHRVRGRWGNTQENAFALLALDRYFRTYESVTPDFVVRMWLGERYAGEHAFAGRETTYRHTAVPMPYLLSEGGAAADGRELIIQKEGEGRLYYRIGLRYAPATLDLPAEDAGFTVERRYEAVDDPADVSRGDDGVWHVKAGARVKVVVTMVAPTRRYHVALVDPLPAGFEALNPALSGTEPVPAASGPSSRWASWWRWFQHQNLRDDRAEAFSTLLWEGVHTYSYFARATTPGTFVAAPPKAEEMYHPETFGRGPTDRVVIE